MPETLIVIITCLLVAVLTYKNHDGTKTDALKEACVFAGLFGAIFAVIGLGAMAKLDQSWNNWLTTSFIVVVVSTVLHYAIRRSSGRHAA